MSDEAVQRNLRGRPPISVTEPSYQVSTRLPETVHERLMEIAARDRCSVSEVLRNIVVLQLKT